MRCGYIGCYSKPDYRIKATAITSEKDYPILHFRICKQHVDLINPKRERMIIKRLSDIAEDFGIPIPPYLEHSEAIKCLTSITFRRIIR